MHYRFLVTFYKSDATTSEDARRHVFNYLTDNGFAHAGGRRWSSGLADWFVIGGRWSGELSRHSWARELAAQRGAIEREHDVQVWGAYYGDKAKQRVQHKLAKQFQEMWSKEAPPAYRDIPIQRDTYKEDGYEDDAMLLTQELYDGLMKQYEGYDESKHHADLDDEAVSPEMVGKKWVVVVDYHN